MDLEFKMQQNQNSIIMVAGVGGGGCSAVNHLYSMDNRELSFMIINTDSQALAMNPIPLKIQLGDGLGAGNNPQRAKTLAEQSEDKIREALQNNNTKMLFVTAGMGGGTGTGASPVVARIARELDILTVGIVSIPYKGEGPKRINNAIKGIEEFIQHVDSLIVIDNAHIAEIYGDLSIRDAHAKADDVLAMAAKNISDIINHKMDVNVDFADIRSVMRSLEEDPANDGKIVLMGSAEGPTGGEPGYLVDIASQAINSPLLHHNDIRGAKNILYNVTCGDNSVSYNETTFVMDFLQQKAALDNQTDIIWGAGEDTTLGANVRVTVIATGYRVEDIPVLREHYGEVLTPGKTRSTAPQRQVVSIDGDHAVPDSHTQSTSGDSEFGIVNRAVSSPSTERPSQPFAQVRAQVRTQGVVSPSHQPHAGVAPTSITSASQSTTPPIEPVSQPSVDADSLNSIYDSAASDEPAYLRRGVALFDDQPAATTTRVKLDSDTPTSSQPTTVSLFD